MTKLRLKHGEEIYYQLISGDPELPCLVFLHEGLGCTQMWKSFPAMLCRHTGCPGLIYDRQGYGRSSELADPRRVNYLHEYALIELPEVLGALIPGRRFFLIGHSDGGSIGLIYASQKPEFLMGVISEAAHVFVDDKTLQGIRAAVQDFHKGKLDGLFKYHADKTVAVFDAWHLTWLSDWFQCWSIEYVLPSIECPLLILQGTDDSYGTVDQVETIASKVSGKCRKLMIENCGHSPHHDQKETVRDVMAGFIRSNLLS